MFFFLIVCNKKVEKPIQLQKADNIKKKYSIQKDKYKKQNAVNNQRIVNLIASKDVLKEKYIEHKKEIINTSTAILCDSLVSLQDSIIDMQDLNLKLKDSFILFQENIIEGQHSLIYECYDEVAKLNSELDRVKKNEEKLNKKVKRNRKIAIGGFATAILSGVVLINK